MQKTHKLIWTDWRSQLQHRVTTVEELRQWINVTPGEAEAIQTSARKYRWSITPYYASLMGKDDENCPIQFQAVLNNKEFLPFPGADSEQNLAVKVLFLHREAISGCFLDAGG